MKIGDKEYSPRFPIMSCMALEGALNMSVIDVVGEIQKPKKRPSLGFMLAITWAGMLHENASLTVQEVGQMMDDGPNGNLSVAYAESRASLVVSAARLLVPPETKTEMETGEGEGDPKN